MNLKKKILLPVMLTLTVATFLAIVFGFYLKLLAGLVAVGLMAYVPARVALRHAKRKVLNKGTPSP